MKISKTGLTYKQYKEEKGSAHKTQKRWQVVKDEHLVDIEKFNHALYNNLDVMKAYNKIRPNSKKTNNNDTGEDR
jgi:hypothetical protein